MPVFFNGSKRILFVHVPKAGGTSIEMFFEANGFKTAYLDRGGSPESLNPVRTCSPQHMHAALLTSLFNVAAFDYVFLTVRHPVGRLVSKFVMDQGGTESVAAFERWVFATLPRAFADPGWMDNHLRPQADFLLPGADIFKLEDGFGESFVARLEARIGLNFGKREVRREMHAPAQPPDFAKVQPGLQDLIRTCYAKDFDTFGYS